MVTVFYSVVVGDKSPVVSINIKNWSAKTWLETLLGYSRFMYSFENPNQNMPDLKNVSSWDGIISTILLIGDIRGYQIKLKGFC